MLRDKEAVSMSFMNGSHVLHRSEDLDMFYHSASSSLAYAEAVVEPGRPEPLVLLSMTCKLADEAEEDADKNEAQEYGQMGLWTYGPMGRPMALWAYEHPGLCGY